MVITVEPSCRACNTNDPVNISVADWTQVKQHLSPVPGWHCPHCGCTAAWWRFARNPDFEDLTPEAREIIFQEQGGQQLFACTIAPGYPIPEDFESEMLNPITRTPL